MPDPGRITGPVVIPDCAQLRLAWTFPGARTFYNVMHARIVGGQPINAALAEDIFSTLVGAGEWTTGLRPLINDAVSLFGVDLRDLRTPNRPLVQSTSGISTGTGSGDMLPPGVALVTTLRTDSAGRGFRGRVYLGGWDEAANEAGGTATAAAAAAATSFIQELSDIMAVNNLILCIGQQARQSYTGTTGAVHPARAAATADVTAILVRNLVFDSQRRRAQ
jgi:hypothetical protein